MYCLYHCLPILFAGWEIHSIGWHKCFHKQWATNKTEVSCHISNITDPIPLTFVSLSHACNSVMLRSPTFFQRLIFHITRRIIVNTFPNQSLNVSVGNPNSAYFPKTLSPLLRCLRVVEAVRQQVVIGLEAWVRRYAPASSVTALNLMQGKGKLSLVTGDTAINRPVQEPERSCSIVDAYSCKLQTTTKANLNPGKRCNQKVVSSYSARSKKRLISFEALVNLENKIVLAWCHLLSFIIICSPFYCGWNGFTRKRSISLETSCGKSRIKCTRSLNDTVLFLI
jgi:hypothetical protein